MNALKLSLAKENYKVPGPGSYEIEGNLVILQGLPSKSSVKFYSLTGILLGSSLTNEDGSLFYDLGSLRNMVVLVETAICNFKISLRDEH